MKRGVGVSRRSVLAAAGAGVVGLHAPAVLGQAKSKYAGTTIHGAAFSLPFHTFLRDYFPEFEENDRHQGRVSMSRPSQFTTSAWTWSCPPAAPLRRDHRHVHLSGPLDRRRLGHRPRRVHQRPQCHASGLGSGGFRFRRAIVAARRQRPHLRIWCRGRRHAALRRARRPDRESRPCDARHDGRPDQGLRCPARQGGRRAWTVRQAAPLELAAVPDEYGRADF